ncbi:hypothetical protein DFH09DRAFT_1309544 [Mycena vulgaris]|nr:hypothetical protein DFH09DRAFT_1309544 [Mycena vulgaris]
MSPHNVRAKVKEYATSIFRPRPASLSAPIPPSILPEDSGKGVGWKVFMQGLGVLKEVSVVFPPLQAAAAGLFRVLEQIGLKITDASDDLGEMASLHWQVCSGDINKGRTKDEDIRDKLEGMAIAIDHQTKLIQQKLAPGVGNIVAVSPDARYVMECIRAVSFLINVFKMDIALHTEAIVSELKVLAADMEIKAQEIKNLVLELHDHRKSNHSGSL